MGNYNSRISSVFTGGMDADSSDRFIKEGDYRLLKNGIIDQSSGGGRYAVKNLKSSTALCTIPDYTGVCLGAKIYKDKIYAFYFNTTSDLTELYEISTLVANTYTLIFSKDLGNSATTRISSIDLVENLTNGDIYCYWTDGESQNQPFKINISLKDAESWNDFYNTPITDVVNNAPVAANETIVSSGSETGDYEAYHVVTPDPFVAIRNGEFEFSFTTNTVGGEAAPYGNKTAIVVAPSTADFNRLEPSEIIHSWMVDVLDDTYPMDHTIRFTVDNATDYSLVLYAGTRILGLLSEAVAVGYTDITLGSVTPGSDTLDDILLASVAAELPALNLVSDTVVPITDPITSYSGIEHRVSWTATYNGSQSYAWATIETYNSSDVLINYYEMYIPNGNTVTESVNGIYFTTSGCYFAIRASFGDTVVVSDLNVDAVTGTGVDVITDIPVIDTIVDVYSYDNPPIPSLLNVATPVVFSQNTPYKISLTAIVGDTSDPFDYTDIFIAESYDGIRKWEGTLATVRQDEYDLGVTPQEFSFTFVGASPHYLFLDAGTNNYNFMQWCTYVDISLVQFTATSAIIPLTVSPKCKYKALLGITKNENSGSYQYAKADVYNTSTNAIVATSPNIEITTPPISSPYLFEFDITGLAGNYALRLYPSTSNSELNNVDYNIISITNSSPTTDLGAVYSEKEDMYNIRHVPMEPSIYPYSNYSDSFVNTQNRAFQFAQRWVYVDGEKTPLSTYSQTAFYPVTNNVIGANAGDISYYVSGGSLYSVSSLQSETEVNTSVGANYDRVICNRAGNIVVVYSTTHDIVPRYSLDYGVTLADSAGTGVAEKFKDGCMSSDGDYIYLLSEAGDIFASTDNGVNFAERVSPTDDQAYNMCCSTNGKYVYFVTRQDDRYRLYRSIDYAVTANSAVEWTTSLLLEQYPYVSLSSNNKNVVFTIRDRVYYSSNYGKSFLYNVITIMPTPYKAHAIFDNGTIIAARYVGTTITIYLSNDYLDTVTTLKTVSVGTYMPIWKFDSMNIGSDIGITYYVGTTLKYIIERYSSTGELKSSYQSNGMIGLTQSLDVRYSSGNIKNIYNNVDITIEKPNYLVERAEIYAIDTIGGNAFLINDILNEDIPDTGITVTFKNDLLYRLLSPTEKGVLFSNVPTKALHQAFCGNRLFYLNYTDGYDTPKPNFSVSVEYSDIVSNTYNTSKYSDTSALSVIAGSVNEGQHLIFNFTYTTPSGKTMNVIFHHLFSDDYASILDARDELNVSFKTMFEDGSVNITGTSVYFNIPDGYVYNNIGDVVIENSGLTYKDGHSMKFGIVYYDEYNRGSFPIFDDSDINISNTLPISSIRYTIRHTPPSWAVRYKLVRNDRDLLYNIVPGFQYVKYSDGKIYLMKYDSDTYMPEAGMILEVYDTEGIGYSFIVESKEAKDADFVDGSPAGDWISISDTGIDGFSGTDIVRGTDLFGELPFYAKTNTQLLEQKLFYEIPGVYDIVNGYHVGTFQNQNNSNPAIVDITNDGNVFFISSVNVKANKVSSVGTFYNGGRPIIEIENPSELNRYASMCWSDQFVQDTGNNGLAMFNLATVNYKNLEISDGEITAAVPIETNLFVWQKDEVGHILIDKDAIVSAAGSAVTTSSGVVAGEYITYGGEYGTEHCESIQVFGNAKYFVDTRRNAVCRLSNDGVTEISDYLMKSYFNSILGSSKKYLSTYNADNSEWWLYDKTNSTIVIFDEKTNRWTRTISPITIDKMLCDGKYVYTINAGVVSTHMTGSTYGSIGGSALTFELKYTANAENGDSKVFNAIELESNKALSTAVTVSGVSSSIAASDFELREGEYFAYIPNSGTSGDLDTGMVVPLGEVLDQTAGLVELKNTPPVMPTLNHTLWYVNGSGVAVSFGTITSINGKLIGTNNIVTPSDTINNRFVFAKENTYLNASNLRGFDAEVSITDSDNTYLEINGVNIDVTKSNNV